MKPIRTLMFALAVGLLAACSNPKTIETPAFTIEMPAGYSQTKDQISIPDYSETIGMTNATGGVSVIAFPRGPEVEKFLYSQSFGGANAELRECTFNNLTEHVIGSRRVHKVNLEGKISGKSVKGSLYAFEEGNYLFLVIGFGFYGAPNDIENIISTISAKPDSRSDEEIGAARLAAVVKVASSTLPRAVDEITTWKGVSVDEDRKCIIMDMEISASPDDIDSDYFQSYLDSNRDEVVIPTFREQRSSDYLIDLPTRLGYDFEYTYTTSDNGKVIGIMHIDNSQLSQ